MKTFKTKIDNVDIQIIKFNPFQGGLLLGKTTKLLAPALKEIVPAISGDLSDEEQIEALINALSDLFDRNTPEEVMEYVKDLIASGYVVVGSNKLLDIDDLEELSGEKGDALTLMMKLVAESIKFNFSGFLGKLKKNQDG